MAERNMVYDKQKDYLEQIDKMLPYFEETDGHAVGANMVYVTLDMYTIARDQLMLDGYLKEIPHKKDNYVLTGKGRDFIKKGGYTAMFAREEKLQQLTEAQLQNVIDTNLSVQQTNTAIQQNIPVQKRQTNISIGVAALSLAFVMASVFKTCTDTNTEEMQKITQQLKEQTQATQGLQQRLEQIDRTLQRTGRDSTNR